MTHPLLQLTADLIDMPSVSFEEAAIADWFEAELRSIEGLEVTRVGDNVVARTNLDRKFRVALGGHIDTCRSTTTQRPGSRGRCCTVWERRT